MGKVYCVRAGLVARRMTGGYVAQWKDGTDTGQRLPIHQLLLNEPNIMEGKESKGIGGIFQPEIWKTQLTELSPS
jgi:hypothetical protein